MFTIVLLCTVCPWISCLPMFTLSLYRGLLCITLLKARFVNVLKKIDKQRTIQSTLTLQQQFLRTSINPATRSQTRLIPFELQPTLSMSRGEAREAYLIKRGKTLSPDGWNRKEECWTEHLYLILVLYCVITYLSIMQSIVLIFSLSLTSHVRLNSNFMSH